MKTKFFLIGLAFMATTAIVSAQCPGNGKGNGKGKCNGTGNRSAYVDSNKNNVCDKSETRTANVTGKKGKAKGNNQAKNFVDANKDGICDNNKVSSKK